MSFLIDPIEVAFKRTTEILKARSADPPSHLVHFTNQAGARGILREKAPAPPPTVRGRGRLGGGGARAADRPRAVSAGPYSDRNEIVIRYFCVAPAASVRVSGLVSALG
jgi:hypothetical protein